MGKKAFDRIMAGMLDALAFAEGDKSAGKAHRVRVPDVDIAKTRTRLKLSQGQFASIFGVSLGTVRNWEQGRTEPDGAARVLLNVIEKEPSAVLRAIRSSRSPRKEAA